jgi:hypothetical protein
MYERMLNRILYPLSHHGLKHTVVTSFGTQERLNCSELIASLQTDMLGENDPLRILFDLEEG